jgi:hypothetical protein
VILRPEELSQQEVSTARTTTIDELVYALYALTPEEKKIVEDARV